MLKKKKKETTLSETERADGHIWQKPASDHRSEALDTFISLKIDPSFKTFCLLKLKLSKNRWPSRCLCFCAVTSASRTILLPSGQMTWSTWERTLSQVSSGVRRLACKDLNQQLQSSPPNCSSHKYSAVDWIFKAAIHIKKKSESVL